ncbi:MAG: prepilin peptidase [Bacillota bacterium]
MDPILLMQLFTYVFLFLIGLVIGSFLNVVMHRFPRGESLIRPRSSCVQCKTILRIPDLFPVISYILLRGRCRYCGVPISLRYPLVELLTAVIIIVAYNSYGFSPQFFKYSVYFYILLVISFIDMDKGIIPNRLVLLLLFWVMAWQLLHPNISLTVAIFGMLAGGGLFYLIAVLSKGGMGGGDIKLMAVLGLTSGWPLVLVVFLLAFLLGAAVGLVLLIAGKKTRRDPLPFGPFLALAFFISELWGLQIWYWYMQYI